MTGIRAKRLFFSSKAVIDRTSIAERRSLSKIGAFVWRRSKSSLRKSTKSAEPGKPPRVHEGGIKRLLFFSFDERNRSVVVGPERYRDGVVPRLMEEGGTATVTVKGQSVRAKYRPHPFMGPAMQAEREAGTFAAAWKDSVR